MKCLSLILMLATTIAYGQKHVQLHIPKDMNLEYVKQFLIGIEYDTKRGKLKKRGSLFNRSLIARKFKISVKGGYYNSKSKLVFIDREAIYKNNGWLEISYGHPKKPSLRKTDSIAFPKLLDFSVRREKVKYGSKNQLSGYVTYDGGEKRHVYGREFERIMSVHNIEVTNSINEDKKTTEVPLSDLKLYSDVVGITVKYDTTVKEIKMPIDFSVRTKYFFGGEKGMDNSRNGGEDLDEERSALWKVLLPNRANSGRGGKYGRDGVSGSVQYLFLGD